MDHPFFGLLFVVLVVVAIVLFVCWDNEKTNQQVSHLVPVVTTAEKSNQETYQNDAGQFVSVVMYDDFTGWLGIHKDTKIISIATVDMSGHGRTTAFVIVYEKVKKE
jgi:hypothetical protein